MADGGDCYGWAVRRRLEELAGWDLSMIVERPIRLTLAACREALGGRANCRGRWLYIESRDSKDEGFSFPQNEEETVDYSFFAFDIRTILIFNNHSLLRPLKLVSCRHLFAGTVTS